MINSDECDGDRLDKIASLSAKITKAVLNSGLTWDEGIAAFGEAAKAIALKLPRKARGRRQNV